MEARIYRDFPHLAAGRVWRIPEVRLASDPHGREVLPPSEKDRLQRAVANEICGHPGPLTSEELSFLCEVAGCLYKDVAEALAVSRSNISVWRRDGRTLSPRDSVSLKKWFWHRLFPGALATEMAQVPGPYVFDDARLLAYMRDAAVAAGLVVRLPADETDADRAREVR